MNERIRELADEATELDYETFDQYNHKTVQHYKFDKEKFAQLIVAEAFRAGMLYSAKKYADQGSEYFTGNDVAMFLEMEACELSDEDIKQHFGVKE